MAMLLPKSLLLVLVLVIALPSSYVQEATAKKSPPPLRHPPPSPPPPPPKAAATSAAFPALTFVGCFNLVTVDTGYIAAYNDEGSSITLPACYQWAVNQAAPYLAQTSYGECAIGNTLGDFVEDSSVATAWSLQVPAARCNAPCTGNTPNAPATLLKCGALTNPDNGDLASIYYIDFTKVQATLAPPAACKPAPGPAAGPTSPAISSGTYRILYPYYASAPTYLGWSGPAGVTAGSVLFSVAPAQAAPFTFTIVQRAAIPCDPNNAHYVWLTHTGTSDGQQYCVDYLHDTFSWALCVASSTTQLNILRPLPLANATSAAALYELQNDNGGLCLYPLEGASFIFTCGVKGSQLQFISSASGGPRL